MCVGCFVLSTGYGRLDVMHFLGGHCAYWEKSCWRASARREKCMFVIGLGSTLLWSYMLKCLMLRDVGVWFSVLSIGIRSVEYLGHSLPAHID